jgi:fibronectin-binding autotransporter adhesin
VLKRCRASIAVLTVVIPLLPVVTTRADAATKTWSAAPSDGNWSNGTNWVGGVAPVAGDDLVFPSASSLKVTNNDLAPGTTINSITVNSAYTLAGNAISLGAAGVICGSLSGGPHIAVPIALSSNVTMDIGLGCDLRLDGVVSGPFGFTKSVATGVLELNGANTFSGIVTVSGGLLVANTNLALGQADGTPATGTVVLAGAALDVFTSTVASEWLSLAGTGPFGSNAAFYNATPATWTGPIVLTADATLSNSHPFTLSGPIGGNFILTKVGNGPLTLAANNTYQQTDVEDGSLYVNGSQTATSVNLNGGLIGGTGASGDIYSSAGTVSPGLSPGAFSSTNVQLDPSSTFAVEINGTAPGSGYDQLIVTGQIILSGAALTGSTGFVPSPGATFVVINNSGTQPIGGTFNGLAQGATVTLGSQAYSIDYNGGDGNDVVLTALAAVPTMSNRLLTMVAALMTGICCWRIRSLSAVS